jgi:hypothetical protein
MKKIGFYLIFSLTVLTGCEKWDTTTDASHVSFLPKFDLVGGAFISIRKSSTSEYVDPGVKAESNGQQLTVYYSGNVVDSVIGVYIITYYATNSDGLRATAERIVAVTEYDVSSNDLSGTYQTSVFGVLVNSKVKRIDSAGYYESDDVMGYPGLKMPGHFVDIGNNQLVLLHGEGYFGKYDGSEGTYTTSTLNWTVTLMDAPYQGSVITLTWRKTQ